MSIGHNQEGKQKVPEQEFSQEGSTEPIVNSAELIAARKYIPPTQTQEAEQTLSPVETDLTPIASKQSRALYKVEFPTAIQIMDAKISEAVSPVLISELVKHRAEIVKQEVEQEEAKLQRELRQEEARHKRVMERGQIAEKFVLAPLLVAIGIVFWSHSAYLGGLIIAAGLYLIAPKMVTQYLNRNKSGNGQVEETSEETDDE